MSTTERINVSVTPLAVSLGLGGGSAVNVPMGIAAPIQPVSGEAYGGAYRITPADVPQVLPTAGLYAAEDFVVEAIPSNYGRVTWDGSSLFIE